MVVFNQEASAKKTDRSESVVLDMEIISSQVSDDDDCTSSPAMNVTSLLSLLLVHFFSLFSVSQTTS